IRDGKGAWLQNASDVTAKYRPGRFEWIVRDASWGNTAVYIEVAPTAEKAGLVAHGRIENAQPPDALLGASGAAFNTKRSVLNDWDFTTPNNLENLTRGFVADDCRHNLVQTHANSWTLQANPSSPTATGSCSAPTDIVIADASAWENPSR